MRRIDGHLHIVGNGSGGSGCWLRPHGWQKLLIPSMLRGVGLKASALKENLDELYVARVLEMRRESSLDAVVILAHDEVYHENGERMENFGSFYVPNDYVLSLARQYPEFLPAVSIHPARTDAIAELERCAVAGAVMMKCLPNCHNIDCSSRRYLKFWEKMVELGLPLLAHTGGEHTVPVARKEFSDPRILRLPLEVGVTVIAAHCATKSGLFDLDYFSVFAEMTKDFPNLYGDTSAFSVPIRGRHVPECLREPLLSRMIYGSDLPVPVGAFWPWWEGTISWVDWRRCAKINNPLERDYQLKRAMGFPEETTTRLNHLLPQRMPVA